MGRAQPQLVHGHAGASVSQRRRSARTANVCVRAEGWQRVCSMSELQSQGRVRSSVSKNGQKAQVLVVTDGKSNDNVYAFSNRCVHMNLPLEGGTPLINATVENVQDEQGQQRMCVTCPFHASSFELGTGEPVGEWAPRQPTIPVVGKPGSGRAPQPVFDVRVNGEDVEVYA